MRNQLSAYADGELRPADMRAVEEHLADCESCQQEYSGVKQLVCLTALIPEEAVPSSLHSAIMTRVAWADVHPEAMVRAQRQPSRPQLWAWGALAGAALTGATASLAVGLINGRHPASRPGLPTPAASTSTMAQQAAAPVEKHSSRKVYVHAPLREHVQVASLGSPAPIAPVEIASQESTSRKPRTVRVSPVTRLSPAPKSAPVNTDPEIDQTTAPDPEKPAVETPAPAPPASPTSTVMAAMPGPSKSDTDTMTASMMASMERDATSRGGSATEEDLEIAPDTDEGLQMLKSFLQERSKMVPQPPAVTMRRMRKTL